MSGSDTAFRKLLGADRESAKAIEKIKAGLGRRTLGDVYGPFENLPGMRGLWTAASIDQAGLVFDRSGQGRSLTMVGNPTVNDYNNLVPFWDYDGNDYHSRVDEAGLDITGTETTIKTALRGLTLGGWFWFDRLATVEGLIAKHAAAPNAQYQLIAQADNTFRMLVSLDGTATTTVSSTNTHGIDSWYFVVGRFDPSAELAVFVNDTSTINTTSIPASIFNGTGGLNIGAQATLNPMDGRCALAFLCAAKLSDNLIKHLFTSSRVVFGV